MKIIESIRKIRVLLLHKLACFKDNIQFSETIIVFAPHPDDEVFGCCGLMQRMMAEGKQVELIIMTGGGKSHASCCDINEDELIRNRRQLTCNAAAIYGLSEEHIHFLDYSDGSVQYDDENTEKLKRVLSVINQSVAGKTTSVFYPHSVGEGWSDHLRTSEIAKRLCASIIPDAKQYEYCVWFWFYNCWKIDWENAITLKMTKQEYKNKLKAIDAYIEPKAPCGRPWSGVLPPVFLWANKWNRELYFQVK